MVAAAQIYLMLPERGTLPKEEVDALCARWDVPLKSERMLDRADVINEIDAGHYLRDYDNPELENRIIDLFLLETGVEERIARGAISRDEHRADVATMGKGEGYQDYMDGLVPLAYMTFSPRIYSVALNGPVLGGFTRKVYLVTVNPEVTLQLLLETCPRQHPTRGEGGGNLDHPDRAAFFGPIEGGLQVLGLVCELAPEVAVARRDEVIAFVQKCVAFNRTLKSTSPAGELIPLSPVLDARARDRALHVLELVGRPEDIPLVEDLMKDPPFTPEEVKQGKTVSDVTVRGSQLLDKLRGMR
jgi:hypothetical protein